MLFRLPFSNKSGHFRPGLLLSLWLLIPSVVIGAGSVDLKYKGSAHDSPTIESIHSQVSPLIPEAITSAENLLGLSLDQGRFRIELHGIVKKGGGRTLKMRTAGWDTLTVYVFIEPILRGYLRDSADILESLTHEIMHVIIRQNISPKAYVKLPIWFREGIPHFLLGQGEERLVNGLGKSYKNPYALLGGLESRAHFAEPEIAGYFFFAQLNEQIGRDGLQRFIYDVLDSQSIDGGMNGLLLQDLDEFWESANLRAKAVLFGYIDEVAEPLFECMTVFYQGRNRNQIASDCFQELIAEYPESYAAEISHYWLAYCYYRVSDFETSQTYFSKFIEFERDYGLLDDARFYELMILKRSGGENAEVLRAAENYLRLFPEAKRAKDVRKMIGPLKEHGP